MKPSTRPRHDRQRTVDAVVDAHTIVGELEKYEEDHPHDAPCLRDVLTAARSAVSAPTAGGDRG